MSSRSIAWIAIRQMTSPNRTRSHPREILPPLQAEDGVPDELDAVVERVELGEHLRQLGQSDSGKNVPATRKSGVSTALTT